MGKVMKASAKISNCRDKAGATIWTSCGEAGGEHCEGGEEEGGRHLHERRRYQTGKSGIAQGVETSDVKLLRRTIHGVLKKERVRRRQIKIWNHFFLAGGGKLVVRLPEGYQEGMVEFLS